jgi:hypothetical protein
MKKLRLLLVVVVGICLGTACADFAFYFSLDGVTPATEITVEPGAAFRLYVMADALPPDPGIAAYEVGLDVSGPGMLTDSTVGVWFSSFGTVWEFPDGTDWSRAFLLDANAVGSGDLAYFDFECTGFGSVTITFDPDSYVVDACETPVAITGASFTVHQVPVPTAAGLIAVGLACAAVRRIVSRKKRA